MDHKYAFVKYIDVFGTEHYVIWDKEEYCVNLVSSTILCQSDDYNLVMAARDEYLRLMKKYENENL